MPVFVGYIPHFGLFKPTTSMVSSFWCPPFSYRESRRGRQIGEHNIEVPQAHLLSGPLMARGISACPGGYTWGFHNHGDTLKSMV